jgi:hypothetical protein
VVDGTHAGLVPILHGNFALGFKWPVDTEQLRHPGMQFTV